MAGKQGPETRLIKKMRDAGRDKYGERLVTVKYHGSQFGEAGVSDLLCVLDGIFVAVEVKAPESYGGSVEKAVAEGPTMKQRAFGARVEKAGGVFAVVASVEGFLETLAYAERRRAASLDYEQEDAGEVEQGVWRHVDDGSPCTSYPDSIRWSYTDETLYCNGHGRLMHCERVD